MGLFNLKKIGYVLFIFNPFQQKKIMADIGFTEGSADDYGVGLLLKNDDISDAVRIMIYKKGKTVKFYSAAYDEHFAT